MTGPDLRAKRQALNMTVADLARTLDVHPETIRNWERGKTTVPRTVDLAVRWIAHERMLALQEALAPSVPDRPH